MFACDIHRHFSEGTTCSKCDKGEPSFLDTRCRELQKRVAELETNARLGAAFCAAVAKYQKQILDGELSAGLLLGEVLDIAENDSYA